MPQQPTLHKEVSSLKANKMYNQTNWLNYKTHFEKMSMAQVAEHCKLYHSTRLVSCGDNTQKVTREGRQVCIPSSTVCGPNMTYGENGKCALTADACGVGLKKEGDKCVLSRDACGVGLKKEGDQCVLSKDSCGVGLKLRDGQCVLSTDSCGVGLKKQGNKCVLSEESCGAGVKKQGNMCVIDEAAYEIQVKTRTNDTSSGRGQTKATSAHEADAARSPKGRTRRDASAVIKKPSLSVPELPELQRTQIADADLLKYLARTAFSGHLS